MGKKNQATDSLCVKRQDLGPFPGLPDLVATIVEYDQLSVGMEKLLFLAFTQRSRAESGSLN